MNKWIAGFICLLVVMQPLFAMPMPSKPMPEEAVPINAGGSSESLAGLADLFYIVLVLGVVVVAGVWMLVDNNDGNDNLGYAIVVHTIIIGITCI